MAVLCCFGVCIPYSVFWPLIVIALREVWQFFFGSVSKPVKTEEIAKEVTVSSPEESSITGGHLGFLTKEMDWKALLRSSRPLYVKFTAKWCKPCKEIEPFVEKLAQQYSSKAIFLNIDVDEYDELAAENGAITIPHFVCFKNGERVDSLGGKSEEKIEAFVLKHL